MYHNALLLTTERLLLRPIKPTDEAELLTLWTNPDVRKYLWDDVIIPVEKVKEFEAEYLSILKNSHASEMKALGAGKLTDEATTVLKQVAKDVAAKF